jgi:hypothetical protein
MKYDSARPISTWVIVAVLLLMLWFSLKRLLGY